MALPVDPSAIRPKNTGEERVVLEIEHETAVERVRGAFIGAGPGVVTEFSFSEMLGKEVDVGRDPCYVLGACNPNMADRALDATDKKMGGLFPCSVVIWEEKPGKQVVYHLSIMCVAQLVGIIPGDNEMADIIADMGELVEQMLVNLDTADA